MPIDLTIDGVTFAYPVDEDLDWGSSATLWAAAVTNLLANFSAPAPPLASTGTVRFGVTDTFAWRNNANDGDLVLSIDANDDLIFQGINLTEVADGNVIGPDSSTDNALARYDGITGQLIQDSSVTLSDTGELNGVTAVTVTAGVTAGTVTATDITSTDITASGSLTGASTDAATANTFRDATTKAVNVNAAQGDVARSLPLNQVILSATSTPITDGTIQIETSGRPVILMLAASTETPPEAFSRVLLEDVNPANNVVLNAAISFYRGATTKLLDYAYVVADDTNVGVGRATIGPGTPLFLDTPPAGVHTYRIEARSLQGLDVRITFDNMQLVAYEL